MLFAVCQVIYACPQLSLLLPTPNLQAPFLQITPMASGLPHSFQSQPKLLSFSSHLLSIWISTITCRSYDLGCSYDVHETTALWPQWSCQLGVPGTHPFAGMAGTNRTVNWQELDRHYNARLTDFSVGAHPLRPMMHVAGARAL